jgi:hypothetical protein
MTTEVLQQSIGAGATAVFGAGRVWYLKVASSPVTIIAERLGSSANVRKFVNVGAGFKFKAEAGEGWTYLKVTSAIAQTIEIIIGDDDVEVSNAVSVTGSVVVEDRPATAMTDSPTVSCATGALTAVVGVNTSRRRVTLTVDPAFAPASGYVYARVAGGSNNLLPLQPGVSVEFRGTYAISVRNDTGTSATVYVLEET